VYWKNYSPGYCRDTGHTVFESEPFAEELEEILQKEQMEKRTFIDRFFLLKYFVESILS